MSVSKARRLLTRAASEKRRLERHLLVAAAISAALPARVVVVGGTAEEFWTRDEYHQTDLDLVTPLLRKDQDTLRSLGFRKEGRHWWHARSHVAVEFPSAVLDGDVARVHAHAVAGDAIAFLISNEDLYLDRVRQATMSWPRQDVNFHSALAVAAAGIERIDWKYVRARLLVIASKEPDTGALMKKIDSNVRREVRRKLSQPE